VTSQLRESVRLRIDGNVRKSHARVLPLSTIASFRNTRACFGRPICCRPSPIMLANRTRAAGSPRNFATAYARLTRLAAASKSPRVNARIPRSPLARDARYGLYSRRARSSTCAKRLDGQLGVVLFFASRLHFQHAQPDVSVLCRRGSQIPVQLRNEWTEIVTFHKHRGLTDLCV
jgi:hypothetical protein